MARERLELLSSVFDAPSRAFLARRISAGFPAAGITWKMRQIVVRASV